MTRGHDFWFHAHEVPGSHVLMRVDKNTAINKIDIEWAAGIAAWFSKARGPGRISVTCANGVEITKPHHPSPVGTVHCISKNVVRVVCVKPHLKT